MNLDIEKLSFDVDLMRSQLEQRTFFKLYHETKFQLESLQKDYEKLVNTKFTELWSSY